jgi:hypothetical protein
MQLVDFLLLQTSIIFLGRRCLHNLVGFLLIISLQVLLVSTGLSRCYSSEILLGFQQATGKKRAAHDCEGVRFGSEQFEDGVLSHVSRRHTL